MIADIIYKNKMYYVLNEHGKEISHNWESTLGELMGFSGSFIVFRKNKMIYTMDDRLKEIAHNQESSLGEFRNVAGNSVNFRRNKMIYTYDSRLKEISHRWEQEDKIMEKQNENKSPPILYFIGVSLLIAFILLAWMSHSWHESEIASQLFAALAGAVIAAFITSILLRLQTQSQAKLIEGQAAIEQEKEKEAKVYEEKLRIYQKFLHS